MPELDATHSPELRSWVASAQGHADFPIQNLPLGVFSPPGAGSAPGGNGTAGSGSAGTPRGGVAIGDEILDLAAAHRAGLFTGEAARAAAAADAPTLNALLALGAGPRRALRAQLSALLAEGSPRRAEVAPLLHAARDCTLHLPTAIGDYTDFYVGIHHATNVGRVFRPNDPLLPNYKYVPIGYHGRASSVRPSGTAFRRPKGQRKPATQATPDFGPCRNLDYELELGIWIGPGNELGEPVAIADAPDQVAGYSLLNDWSARDIQAWEYQPLGPFLAKSFCSTVSTWIVTPEALAPFRVPQPARPEGDPAPLPYLADDTDAREGALDLELEVLILTPAMRDKGLPPERLSRSNAQHMYWTVAQMLAHHTSNGCNLQPGDLLGSGTLSAPGEEGFGSLLESTKGGKEPVQLASGETRRFLEDGDEVFLRAQARRPGAVSIGFGECRGTVLPAI